MPFNHFFLDFSGFCDFEAKCALWRFRMRKIFIVLLLLCAFFKIFADDDEKQKLAVMEFEDLSKKLPAEMLISATEYIRGAFVSSNKFIVIAKERQEKAMIKEMKKESYKTCNDKNCQIPLGQALSADTILRTTINFFGGVYTITSELIDLAKEATVVGAKVTFKGDETSLRSALDEIVRQITSTTETTATASVNTSTTASTKPKNNDNTACNYARKNSKKETWELYLKTFPDGECAFEAFVAISEINKKEEAERERRKKGVLYWSNKAPKMNWDDAVNYCQNLNEGGYNDWKLPNINELRSLITNCPQTTLGGTCQVTTNCLFWGKCNRKNCDGCYQKTSHSKLGDTDWFWSSSSRAEDNEYAWYVNFDNARISSPSKKEKGYVRCVR